MLERLERWAPPGVQRDDLAVHDHLVGLQPRARRRDGPIHPGEVVVLSRPKLDSLLVLDDQRPIAIELQLVYPVVAFRETLHDLRSYGRNERREVSAWVRNAGTRTGRLLFFFAVVIRASRSTPLLCAHAGNGARNSRARRAGCAAAPSQLVGDR